MKKRSDLAQNVDALREKIIGLGERSIRKSYYPELLQQFSELERFRALLDESADAILVAQNGNIIDANKMAYRLFGKSSALLSSSVRDVVPEATWSHIEAAVCHRNTVEKIIETNIVRPDETVIVVEMSVRPVTFGEAAYAVIVARDITERKRADEQRKGLEEQIRQLQKMEMVGLLAGGIAHDFNNLLMPILGYSGMLYDDLAEEDPRRESIQIVREAAERARDLTRQLLAFSRKQTLDLKSVDLGNVLRRFESVLRRTITENVRIEIKIEPTLGDVRADVGGIEQVLMNLSINARDAMPEGGILTIEASNLEIAASSTEKNVQAEPGSYVMLAVSDTGMGMDENTREHIFEPFFTTKEPGKGSGLGLSTVYGIVKQHAGFISVFSEPGHGTSFKIFLPRVKENVSTEQLVVATQPLRGSETVLVIEDNDIVRSIVSEMLTTLGYRVLTANTVQDCIELAKKRAAPVDLLLTDIIMPTMNGVEVFDLLKRIHPELKVLYMSGYPGAAMGKHGVLVTESDFIQKPFTIETLSERIRKIFAAENEENSKKV